MCIQETSKDYFLFYTTHNVIVIFYFIRRIVMRDGVYITIVIEYQCNKEKNTLNVQMYLLLTVFNIKPTKIFNLNIYDH